MTERRRKIAALVADAFQEEEYFFPKVALNEAGYQVEVVSSHKEPVEIYSYFARTGLLDVDRAIADAPPEDYEGVLVPGVSWMSSGSLTRTEARCGRTGFRAFARME